MKIQICTWKSCKTRFSEYILKRINWDIEKYHLDNVTVETCGCLWNCKEWPNAIIDGKKENYCDPIKVSKIMLDKINQRKQNKKQDKKVEDDEKTLENENNN